MEYKSYRFDVIVHARPMDDIRAAYAISDRDGRLVMSGTVNGHFSSIDEARVQGDLSAFNWIDQQTS